MMTLQSITLVADSTSVTKRTTGVMKNPAMCGVFFRKKRCRPAQQLFVQQSAFGYSSRSEKMYLENGAGNAEKNNQPGNCPGDDVRVDRAGFS